MLQATADASIEDQARAASPSLCSLPSTDAAAGESAAPEAAATCHRPEEVMTFSTQPAVASGPRSLFVSGTELRLAGPYAAHMLCAGHKVSCILTCSCQVQGTTAHSAKAALGTQSIPPVESAAASAPSPEVLTPQGSAIKDTLGQGKAPAQAAQLEQAFPAQHVPTAPAGAPAQQGSAAQEQPQQAQTLLGEVNNAVGAIAMPTPAGTPHSWEDTGAYS